MNSELLGIIGLVLSVVATVVGVSRWIHSQFADLARDVDKRLDAMLLELTTLRADFRVHQKECESQFIRLDAWTKSNHDDLSHALERMRATEKAVSRRIGDLELFLAKTLSFVVRERE